jgi:hypothetical protein
MYHSAKKTTDGCKVVDNRVECMAGTRLHRGESKNRMRGIELKYNDQYMLQRR